MSQAAFVPSFALFDEQGALLDWNQGFAEEFPDAAGLMAPGLPVAAIRQTCLLPERALDLSWAGEGGAPPTAFNYVNGRRSIEVVQDRGRAGGILRVARAMGPAPRLHTQVSEDAADLLRSSMLQMSVSVLQRRSQEEENLRIARAAADAANQAKSAFLAVMSHELRTPLNGILGMAQLLLLPDLDEAERQEFTRTILNSGRSLLTLLNDVLDLSKIEAGKTELELGVVDIAQLARQVGTLFTGTARDKSLTLELDLDQLPAGQRYRADATRLRQMLNNLTNNAIKFTERGGVRLMVEEIRRDGPQAELLFSVIDTGVGIAPDKLGRLFQAFSQADSSITRKHGGTGLGLSIVRQLATLMGGEAGVTSEEGRGSTFWFRISAECLDIDAERRRHPRQFAGGPRSFAGLDAAILVVDDNPSNRLVMKAFLTKTGLQPILADSGLAALAAATQEPRPALVFMDCRMPEMDGFEAARRIRTWEAEAGRPRVPIVALTASVEAQDRILVLESGMDEIATKPVDFNALRAILNHWLSHDPAPAN